MNDFGCCETRVDYKEKWKEVHVLQVEKDDLKGRVERDFKENHNPADLPRFCLNAPN